MKTTRIPILALVAALLAAPAPAQQTSAQTEPASKTFMRKKLEYSHKLFEGVVLERYDIVAKNTLELSRVIDTNSYLFSRDTYYFDNAAKFRTDTADLFEAAIATNGTRVMASYHKVTEDCVACHRQFHRADLHRQAPGHRPL